MASDGTARDTIDDPVKPARARDLPQPYLFVVLQCDRPTDGAARYSLAEIDHVFIDRGPARDAVHDRRGRKLLLHLPGNFVSSQHAVIQRDTDGWCLTDRESRNGTYLNGESVMQVGLRDGDILQIGHTVLSFRSALPDSADINVTDPASTDAGLATLLPDLGTRLAALLSIARAPVPVLLLGETGTGKEVLARSLHTASGRPGALVAVNCGALTPSLLESQLFGHKKGAFTGALRDEQGYVRAAHKGTLFLDEIGDLPLPAQAALLRVLQESEVVPVGDTRPHKVDLRVVAATHQPLDDMAASGKFRSDLLARLAGYRHELAPLRERREDLGLIIGKLLRRIHHVDGKVPRLVPEVGRLLLQYHWPLNIRELQQCLVAAVALAESDLIEPAHLPTQIREACPPEPVPPPIPRDPEGLRQCLIALLEQHQGNVSGVARELGKARFQVHRWMQRFGLDPNDFRQRRPSDS
jgi:DNA-binding NtrC family response regulator